MVRRVAALGPTLDPWPADPAAGGGDSAGTLPGPRIVVGFYDGYGFAGRFGAELCAELGVRATFFPLFEPTDESGCAELTDDELAEIARHHEIGFHTSSHVTPEEITPDALEREVFGPLRRIEAITGRMPRLAAWRGGARFDPRRLGDAALVEAGVRGMMSNWSVERFD
nr:polysaccharide deacetylase family protein [Nakamurella flavida]